MAAQQRHVQQQARGSKAAHLPNADNIANNLYSVHVRWHFRAGSAMKPNSDDHDEKDNINDPLNAAPRGNNIIRLLSYKCIPVEVYVSTQPSLVQMIYDSKNKCCHVYHSQQGMCWWLVFFILY